jgi:histone H3/H4
VAKKKTARKAAPKKKTSAKKKSAGRAKKPAMEMLLVGSKTKAALKASGMNVAGDALEGLNGLVYWYIEQAAKRAASNGRKTVRSHDFVIM